MSFDLMPFGAPVQEPMPRSAPAASEARTLTLRLRATGTAARIDAPEGSLFVPVAHAVMPHSLHARVMRADAAPLTLTLHRA